MTLNENLNTNTDEKSDSVDMPIIINDDVVPSSQETVEVSEIEVDNVIVNEVMADNEVVVDTVEAKADVSVTNDSNGNAMQQQASKYLLLGWDLDLTGRRLIDEMFHVAAYAIDKDVKFTQYVMPSMNLNPVARYRHAVTIVNVTRYRMLKDLRNRKVLRSRSEYSGLTIFLEWLENLLKNSPYKKIIFMWHDSQKIAPLIFLKSLQRYNMLERFANCLEGFLDTFELIKTKCPHLKAFSQRALMKSVLECPKEQNESLSNALFRAQLTSNLIQKLFNNDISLMSDYLYIIDDKLNELNDMKELLDRQKSLKPIFLPFLRANHWTRQQANRLRKILADNNFDFVTLQNQWQRNGIEGLKGLLEKQLESLKISNKDLDVAVRILDSYFDPTKKPLHYLSHELFSDLGNYNTHNFTKKTTVNFVADKLTNLSINSDAVITESTEEVPVKSPIVKAEILLTDDDNNTNSIAKESGLLLQKASNMVIVKEIVA